MQRLREKLLSGRKLCQPPQQVNIANSSGRLFDVRFEMIRRIVEAGMAQPCAFGETFREFRRSCADADRIAFRRAELKSDGSPSRKRTSSRLACNSTFRLIEAAALRDRSDRMADLQFRIPKDLEYGGERLLDGKYVLLLFEQQQQIDVGTGEELSPTIAADRENCVGRRCGVAKASRKCIRERPGRLDSERATSKRSGSWVRSNSARRSLNSAG